VPGKVVEAPPGKLGVVFGTDPATGYATITLVRETSPLKGKVEVNDIVIAIDGEDTSTHTNEQIVKRKFCLRCTRVSGSSRPRCETRVEPHPGYAPRYRTPTCNLDSLAAVPHPPRRPRRQGSLHSIADARWQGLIALRRHGSFESSTPLIRHFDTSDRCVRVSKRQRPTTLALCLDATPSYLDRLVGATRRRIAACFTPYCTSPGCR
jgi:hypothetical protein